METSQSNTEPSIQARMPASALKYEGTIVQLCNSAMASERNSLLFFGKMSSSASAPSPSDTFIIAQNPDEERVSDGRNTLAYFISNSEKFPVTARIEGGLVSLLSDPVEAMILKKFGLGKPENSYFAISESERELLELAGYDSLADFNRMRFLGTSITGAKIGRSSVYTGSWVVGANEEQIAKVSPERRDLVLPLRFGEFVLYE